MRARTLGRGERTARIPVVALSALPLESDADWRLAGFAGYVEKPISVGEFPTRCAATAACRAEG